MEKAALAKQHFLILLGCLIQPDNFEVIIDGMHLKSKK